jgi:hypothetical protein
MLLNHLARHLDGHQITIDNPFVWRTKVEVVRELSTTGGRIHSWDLQLLKHAAHEQHDTSLW